MDWKKQNCLFTDQKHIAEHFNNFFTIIGKKLQKKYPAY